MIERHGGRILIDEEVILNAVGYKGGHIRYIGWSSANPAVVVVFEHPDLPAVPVGGEVMTVEARPNQ